MYIFTLAVRNLFGKGLRSWLNFVVLSFAFVTIIWLQGMNDGMLNQAGKAIEDEEIASGQYWHSKYEKFDPFTIDESLAEIPSNLLKEDVPILMRKAIAYPHDKMRAVILKGIPKTQKLLKLPTDIFSEKTEEIEAFIGKRMAKNSKLKEGDFVTVRWKNRFGGYDANEIKIKKIQYFQNPSVDNGTIWISFEHLEKMIQTNNQASMIISSSEVPQNYGEDWVFKTPDFLLADIKQMVKMKSGGSAVLFIILLSLAVISIFDTQILNLFQRRKEMGTMMALGLTRTKLVLLFTLEGFMNAIMAALIGAVYGIPLLYFSYKYGIQLPKATDDYGIAGLSTKLYPYYSLNIILGTTSIVFILVILVSYLPSRKISKLKPTDALRGKWTIKNS